MKSIIHRTPTLRAIRSGLAFALIGTLGLIPAHAEIDPAARTLVRSMAAKVAEAQTIRLTANHKMDPELGVGSQREKGPIEITVRRPNQFYAIQKAGVETREIAYDGKMLALMHPELGHHALETVPSRSIGEFADRVDELFGFRPPVAELLSANVETELFRDVTSATLMGTEFVGMTRCDRLHFEQDGMTGDFWIAKKDQLPRRYRLTFTDIEGKPKWDIRLKKWELNPAIDDLLFSKRPAANSQKVKMLKAR